MAIITISREMGTGAYEIAAEVTRKLKYTLVDGKCISARAPKYGLSQEMLQMVDEKPPSYITSEDRKRAAALNTIELIQLDYARKGNVILYGRGGQYLLKDCGNILRLRLTGEFEERVGRLSEREWIDPDLARFMTRRSDHQRSGYVQFYFDRVWNDPLGYDITYNTSRLPQKLIVESIVAAAKDSYLKQAEAGAVEKIDNAILVNRIESALLNADALDYHHFKIVADQGHVLLSGYLASAEEKESAIRVVSSVKGVVDVDEGMLVVNSDAYKNRG